MRIILPMLAAIVVARISGVTHESSDWLSGIPAWSLIAELIYYTLYPLMRKVCDGRWGKATVLAFLIGIVFPIAFPADSYNYAGWNYWGDWILGLPCWMMGIVLVGWIQPESKSSVDTTKIWTYRIIGVLIGAITHNLKLQWIFPEYASLNWFSIYALFWLYWEIRYYQQHKPFQLFESLGGWSYSLYLVHPASHYIYNERLGIPRLGYMVDWAVSLAFTLAFAFVFYMAIERYSHMLARHLGRSMAMSTDS